eukprot:gene34632-41937_t
MHASMQLCTFACLALALFVPHVNSFLMPGRGALRSSLDARSYSWISKTPKPPASSSSSRAGFKGKASTRADKLKTGEKSRGNSFLKSPKVSKAEPVKIGQPESKFSTQRKRVERLFTPDQQKPLADFYEGQELKGRVISFARYGMFVDVGTAIDGLVHIKDASNVYFITDLSTRYQPGEEVTVWVKFVNAAERKLGLQLFPYTPPLERKYSWADLSYEMPVEGKIVKFSDSGAYVDIGGPKLAYMPRRNMKSNYRQRNMKPWELEQLNNICQCFVMQSDEDEGQLIVSTFAPTEWEKRFLLVSKTGRKSTQQLDERRRSNDDAIARTMGLKKKLVVGDDDDDDYMDEEDDSEGEETESGDMDVARKETSEAEDQGSNYKIILDDVGDSQTPRRSASKSKPKQLDIFDDSEDSSRSSEEISTEDLFAQLASGKPFITLKEVKQWVYLQQLVKAGRISFGDLPAMFARAGGSTSLSFEEFNTFMELFAERVGIETVYDEEEDDVEMRGVKREASDNFMHSEDEDDGDEEDLKEFVFGLDSPAPAMKSQASDFTNQPTGGSTLLETTYRQLAGKEKSLTLNKLMSWDFCQAMLQAGQVDEEDLTAIAKDIMGKDKTMSFTHFQTFVENLKQVHEEFNEMDNDLNLGAIEDEEDDYDENEEDEDEDDDAFLEGVEDLEVGDEIDDLDES